MRFNPPVPIQKTKVGRADWFEVVKDTRVNHPVQPYTIEAGYITDLISCPWLLYPLIQPHAAGSNEAIFHDWEHDNNFLELELGSKHARHLSNLMLAARMIEAKAPMWQVWAMLIYCTLFSGITWKKKKPNEEPI